MSGDEGHESFPAEELGELVDRLDEEIKTLLVRNCVSEAAAGEIVYETMMGLAHRWHAVRDRERWFLEALEHACVADGTDPESDIH